MHNYDSLQLFVHTFKKMEFHDDKAKYVSKKPLNLLHSYTHTHTHTHGGKSSEQLIFDSKYTIVPVQLNTNMMLPETENQSINPRRSPT
jgi:hypothetical protein